MELTQQEAQHIIRKLGESGIPPTRGLEAYTVGMDSLLGTLESEYLKGYLRDGGSSFKLVVGEYGSGKSHFLYRLRDIAWENGYVVSRTELSPKECPYDNQLKVYQAIISNLIYHDPDPNIADTQGIEAFLENHFFHTMRMLGIEQVMTSIGLDVRVKMWLETILRFKVESPSYRHAVYFFLQAAAEENEAKKRVIGAWLRGEAVPMKDVREFSITERIDRSVAFKMLRSLAQLVHELGYAGLALLFDEGDRMVSIGSSRTEKVACDNLREVIDRCAGESLPSTLFAYAVPPYFVTNIAPQYEALSQRISSKVKFSRKNPYSVQISLDQLDYPGEELLRKIGEKLLGVFETAYGIELNHELQAQNIAQLADTCAALLSTSHRRHFVKSLIDMLAEQRAEGEHLYEQDSVQNVVRAVTAQLGQAQGGEY
ncbi:MAG: BREX system ATP-binding domain-containing protein [Acidobacteriota bacterium]|nr:BREX system ATP-binding domain-containing protein [Acidobacteriota bacterium]